MRLALELSRTRCAALLVNDALQPQNQLVKPFSPTQNAATRWLETVKLARETLFPAALEPHQLSAIGLAFEGALSGENVVQKSPFSLGFEGYNLERGLREHLELAQWGREKLRIFPKIWAQGLGESRFGGLQNVADWVFLDLDGALTSVCARGGAMFDGDLGALVLERDGALDEYAKRGTLRAFCGETAFEARCRSFAIAGARDVWRLAPSNFAAQSLAQDFAARLAQGIGGAIAVLRPQKVVLGGEFCGAIWNELHGDLASFLRDIAPQESAETALALAQTGTDAALLGVLG